MRMSLQHHQWIRITHLRVDKGRVKLLLLIAVVAGGLYHWGGLPSLFSMGPGPLRDSPYVMVYGRDNCGITKRMLADLGRAGIPYTYKIVDDTAVKEELHPRMKAAGLNTRKYGLPVVDVNGKMMMSPKSEVVAQKYAKAPSNWGLPKSFSRTKSSSRTRTEAMGAGAAGRLTDPLVACRIHGHDTYTLRSQCPEYAR